MKYTNLRAFEKHLEDAAPQHFADIYLILAKDAFERKAASDRLISLLLKDESHPEFALKVFDADRHSIQEILEELNGFSMFSQKRVVIVQDVDKLNKNAATQLERYFAKPSSSVCLVLAASTLNHSTNFFKNAEKVGVVLDVAEEKPWEKEKSAIDWIQRKVAVEGKRITLQACQILLKQLGTDQATLYNELEKLYCYVGERQEITLDDIGVLCACVNLETAWQLGDAIFQRDPASALRITKALLGEGTAFLMLLRQLRSQFQTKFQICSILTSGGAASDVVHQYPYMKGQILDRNIQMAQNYGMKRFREGMLKIDETEALAKNSQADEKILAELLIIRLTI